MRIAFDMDGVLADMDRALTALADEMFGREQGGKKPASTAHGAETGETGGATGRVSDLPVLLRLTSRQESQLWRRAKETRNFWEKLHETEEGVVARLARVTKDLGWDVLFITQRPASSGSTVQVQTQRWLRKHGFEMPSVFTTQGSRGRIAAALTLDAVVDDRLENCVDVASESKAWPILVWRGPTGGVPVDASARRLGIAVVPSVTDAIARIEAADRAPDQHGHRTLFDRLKRALGA
jgi:hypothetical protein